MEYSTPKHLEHLPWNEVADFLTLKPVGILPIGAIEAHGPHLPLNSDVLIALGMAKYGASQLHASGLPALVLPAISYSVSFAGACFPGTTPVGGQEFRAYLTSILSNHAPQGYRAICLANAHLEPAHVEIVREASETAQENSGIPITFPDQRAEPWATRLGREFRDGSRHAGCYETSIMLAEAPELVRRTQLEELEPVWIDLPAALRAGASDFAEAGAAQGYFGDPRSATADHGIELLTTLGTMVHDSVLDALAKAG
jgi:creatinine amidohydrolase